MMRDRAGLISMIYLLTPPLLALGVIAYVLLSARPAP